VVTASKDHAKEDISLLQPLITQEVETLGIGSDRQTNGLNENRSRGDGMSSIRTSPRNEAQLAVDRLKTQVLQGTMEMIQTMLHQLASF
jgi:hypothetical protein